MGPHERLAGAQGCVRVCVSDKVVTHTKGANTQRTPRGRFSHFRAPSARLRHKVIEECSRRRKGDACVRHTRAAASMFSHKANEMKTNSHFALQCSQSKGLNSGPRVKPKEGLGSNPTHHTSERKGTSFAKEARAPRGDALRRDALVTGPPWCAHHLSAAKKSNEERVSSNLSISRKRGRERDLVRTSATMLSPGR